MDEDNRAITLIDVADRAGVSRATASLVVRGTGRVSDATRARVRQAMADLGYVYNRGAASLRRQQADTVGVIITNVANPFFGELLRGFEAVLSGAALSCLIVNTGQDPAAQIRAIEELRERRVAGVAVVPASGSTAAFVDTLRSWRLPHVFMTRYIKNAPTHYVGADDQRGGYLATAHLLDHGTRQIAYLGGPVNVQSRWDRRAGVEAALHDHGLDADQLFDLPGESSGSGGLAIGQHLIDNNLLPQAIVCHSDQVAFGVYRALRRSHSHALPRIIGYDDIPTASLWEPPLTTISTNANELGGLAAHNLLQQIDTSPDTTLTTITTPSLIIRESCGCHDQPNAAEPTATPRPAG
ncbi:MAG TPA: LacI family DNA-binding transcriptional regulator [Microlunatus sp.]|nr:LacI family DNA-binding transcriptional regulator [Microlunatus sp.]